MFAGMRPYVTAGVALVGAGVIAVTPVAPAGAAEVPVMSPAVQLAAIPSPLQLYPQVFNTTLQNAGALLGQYFADPFPIIGATIENQAVGLEDAFTALQFGRFDEFFAAVADVVLEPFRSAGAALSYLDAILRQPYAMEGFFLIAISPVLSGIAATGNAIAEVFEAITTFDIVGLVNAVINIPARIIDGVLNGVPGASFGILEDLPGLLSPLDSESYRPPGPIAVGIGLDQDMGAAIPPRTPEATVDETPEPDGATFALASDVSSEEPQAQEESVLDAWEGPDLSGAADDDGAPAPEELEESTPEDEDEDPGSAEETEHTEDEASPRESSNRSLTPETSDAAADNPDRSAEGSDSQGESPQ